ncbi:nmrA-like family domain-containing protein [Fusarium bulbicola]|nr:nmrA-like family domain-containing protein [Fusarium bulbicola]
MEKKIITIVGVTGTQGASVADVFLQEGGWHVRGITRDPSKPSSQAWADKGVELIEANINDAAALKSAFAGSNVIFGVTDFWTVVYDPKTQALAKSTGQTETEIAYKAEKQQARNIADAAYAIIETLDRLVFSTLLHTRKWSNGKYTHNLHFDAKWEGAEYLKATYPALDNKTSYLQQPDGTFKLSLPTDSNALIPLVEPRKDTGKFAKALIQGKVHRVTYRYKRLDRKVLEAAVPGYVGKELADIFKYISEFGYDSRDPTIIYPENLGVHIPVYTAEEYIREEKWPEV